MAGRPICHGDRGHPRDDGAGDIRAWVRASRAAQCLPPLITDPARPAELGRHDGPVEAVRADGRVVTGGDDHRVLVRDPAGASTQVVQLTCSVTALATPPHVPARSNLVIAHQGRQQPAPEADTDRETVTASTTERSSAGAHPAPDRRYSG
jgi:hypothetical protein